MDGPRGEGLGELGERVERALRRIAAAHPDQTVAVFSHGTAIRQALARIKGIPPEEWHGLRHSDNTAVSCLKWDGAAFQLAFEGDNSHLDPAISTLARQSLVAEGREAGGGREPVVPAPGLGAGEPDLLRGPAGGMDHRPRRGHPL